jgi:ribosomal protein L11 methylase PrmA
VLDRRWFLGKRCLDIGCNEGVITLAAVQRFAPLSMLGVDIDEGLIKTACRCVQPLGMDMNVHGTHMLCQKGVKMCLQIRASAGEGKLCVRNILVEVLLQMTTVQLHSVIS